MDAATVAAWVTGIGSVLAAIWGVVLVVREVRSRQRHEIARLDTELQLTQEQLVATHLTIYQLKVTLADQGIDVPDESDESS